MRRPPWHIVLLILTVVVAATLIAVQPTTPAAAGPHKILVFVDENHSRVQAMAGMPHLAHWAATYGQATHYNAVTHPSLPNYLAMFGGSTFGITDDKPPSSHPLSGASVFGQTRAAGKTAKSYQESMSSHCQLTSSGSYAVKHNPWAYFTSTAERNGCNAKDVPSGTTASGALLADVNNGTLPVTGEVTPNLCNDAHNCSLATADAWLHAWVPKVMAGPDYQAGRLTIILTWDEGTSSDNNVAFVVIDPRLHGKVVTSPVRHYALTRWLDENAGVSLLRNASTAPDLRALFGLG